MKDKKPKQPFTIKNEKKDFLENILNIKYQNINI
jgi:hypothetical protein